MFRAMVQVCSIVAVSFCFLAGCSQKAEVTLPPAAPVAIDLQRKKLLGESLFKQFCHNCHPDGGNVSDPDRTLRGSILRQNHISHPQDIVRIMRNPISRMIRFDADTISDADALLVAEFVLDSFK